MPPVGAPAQPLHLGQQGRIVIPAAYRKALRLEPGDTLVVWLEGDDRLVLRPRKAVEQELWTLFEDVGRSLSAELIHERRSEAQAEASR